MSELAQLNEYIDSVRAALDGIEAFDIKFHGITVSRSAVLAQGFPCGPALETLRERLRTKLRDAGLDASLDQRYRLITAHSTLFRFVAPLHRPQQFAAQLGSLRDEPLGCMRVNEVELVVNDWYMSSSSLERIAKVPFTDAHLKLGSMSRRRSAMGRQQPVVTVCDFSISATCYANAEGRVRPEGDVAVVIIGNACTT